MPEQQQRLAHRDAAPCSGAGQAWDNGVCLAQRCLPAGLPACLFACPAAMSKGQCKEAHLHTHAVLASWLFSFSCAYCLPAVCLACLQAYARSSVRVFLARSQPPHTGCETHGRPKSVDYCLQSTADRGAHTRRDRGH